MTCRLAAAAAGAAHGPAQSSRARAYPPPHAKGLTVVLSHSTALLSQTVVPSFSPSNGKSRVLCLRRDLQHRPLSTTCFFRRVFTRSCPLQLHLLLQDAVIALHLFRRRRHRLLARSSTDTPQTAAHGNLSSIFTAIRKYFHFHLRHFAQLRDNPVWCFVTAALDAHAQRRDAPWSPPQARTAHSPAFVTAPALLLPHAPTRPPRRPCLLYCTLSLTLSASPLLNSQLF